MTLTSIFNAKTTFNKDSIGLAVRVLGIDFSIFTIHETNDMDLMLNFTIRGKCLIFLQLAFIAFFVGRANSLYDKNTKGKSK